MGFKMKDYVAKAREAVSEGFVLLKNDNNLLPLKKDSKVAIFGRTQFDYFKSGTGSGGLVNTGYIVNIIDALESEDIFINSDLKAVYEKWLKSNPFDVGVGWATEPWFQKEMTLTKELVSKVRKSSDIAIVVIGRTAGEDKDNKVEEGSYLLTKDEEDILSKVTTSFKDVIVLLNTGNIIDMSWVEKYKPSSIAYIWQGGQEGCKGVADVVMGRVTPSGKLPNTIVYNINDIPSTATFGDHKRAVYEEDIYVGYRYFETFAQDKVMYPFGFGLSYTTFSLETISVDCESLVKGLKIKVKVTNTGNTKGKEVVQVYVSAPQGKLGKPLKSLCAFGKTKTLKPLESEEILLNIPKDYLISYDDSGITGNKSAYVLEAGEYKFFVGNDVRSSKFEKSILLKELVVVEQLTEAMAPLERFEVIKPKVMENGDVVEERVSVSTRTVDYDKRIQDNLPKSYDITGDKGYKLVDVEKGVVSIEEFIAQLSKEDLVTIVRGEGMCSPKATPGIAGAFGGVTDSLKSFGIPIAGCADGPSGIRMDCGTMAFSMPNGTLLASTFNENLLRELFEWEALELRKNKIDTLLGPGINIHRNPLNGRNFEYFSEDPILTGRLTIAQLEGMHKYNVTGTIKHFACNNQETMRNEVETIASERAIREVYLKAFEMAVKESSAYSIMTSYNPINGYWSASNYELLTVILREEWGYKGIVMTDWWARGNFTGEEGVVKNTSSKAQAQNDLNMVNLDASDMSCDNSLEDLNRGRVTVGDYQRCAKNICEYILSTPAYKDFAHGEDELYAQLEELVFEGEEIVARQLKWDLEEVKVFDGSALSTLKGDLNLISLNVKELGEYKLHLTCRASKDETEVSQIPVTILKDKEIVSTITIIGKEKEWKTVVVELPKIHANNGYLKLMFAQGGMEVKEIRLELCK